MTAVSHDLRTPLTTIKGLANEILRGGEIGAAAIIEGEADRLNALVSDLLDLSRIHAGALRPILAVNTIDDLIGAAERRPPRASGWARDFFCCDQDLFLLQQDEVRRCGERDERTAASA